MLSGVVVGVVVLMVFVVLSIGCLVCFFIIKDMEVDVVEKGEWGRLVGIVLMVLGLMILCVVVLLVYY